MLSEILAWCFLAWYVVIVVACSIGWIQLVRHYSTAPEQSSASRSSISDSPHVTVIRPVKGREPYLYDCLAATFHQDYPRERLSIRICISSRDDPALPLVYRLVKDFPAFDVRIFIEDDDLAISGYGGTQSRIGPNPKIRNMSRAYREAEGDIVWILDCNVWVSSGVCGRMVDRLCGRSQSHPGRPYKFVHQLPICVDVQSQGPDRGTNGWEKGEMVPPEPTKRRSTFRSWASTTGGRLEEVFLSSSHAKFYTTINKVAIAPCIVGKSNMFRRSHLNYLTSASQPRLESKSPHSQPTIGEGLDFFSYNICEDHLIGDLLWRGSIPFAPSNIGKHALLDGDLAIQPVDGVSVAAFIARRVRWLRVRKFTVLLATLVEPGTESFLCSAYGAYALTSLGGFRNSLGLSRPWTTFAVLWLLSVSIWALVDWSVYLILHSGRTIERKKHDAEDERIPIFAKPPRSGGLFASRRPFLTWLAAWLGREALALPIWIWAFWGGVTVAWKNRKFRVGMDMKIHEIVDDRPKNAAVPHHHHHHYYHPCPRAQSVDTKADRDKSD